MKVQKLKVLCVEDNTGDARLLRELLMQEQPPVELITVASLEQAIAQLGETKVDVVLLDLSLPDSQGLETVRRMQAAAPTVPVVVLTGFRDDALGIQCVQSGAQDYLIKGQIE